jgi:hypothetical protein
MTCYRLAANPENRKTSALMIPSKFTFITGVLQDITERTLLFNGINELAEELSAAEQTVYSCDAF